MTDNADSEQPNPEDFEAFMREFLEKGAQGMDVEKLAAAAGLPSDPAQMAALMAQLRAALGQMASSDGSVNWKLATDQARQLAASESEAPSVETQSELVKALSIATLWLNGATQISELTAEPKFLTRELWVQDAMPLFQALATPVAERMSAALSDSLRESAPEEIVGMIGNATSMMKSLGGALFAMQLGQSLGKLSSEVLTGGDIGLPIFSDQRAAFVTQNIKNYITALDVETDQVLIYLAVRELAHARLFKHSRWLREHVINQITQYARSQSMPPRFKRHFRTVRSSLREAKTKPERLKASRTHSHLSKDGLTRLPTRQQACCQRASQSARQCAGAGPPVGRQRRLSAR